MVHKLSLDCHFFCVDRKSELTAYTGHYFNYGNMNKMGEGGSQKPHTYLKKTCMNNQESLEYFI
jgi:hypothetical protein